ncbi:protein of unknown function [Candidatus Nitrotoga arctica]|uniref:Uncharacterized protein n=1 Tax=Candidatus Nitrotoga arctica TaxID=453162 RepID=A0ABN8AMN2_9PROT|nr:protein of unknown function [Candidatus Nitrotoga arctica]
MLFICWVRTVLTPFLRDAGSIPERAFNPSASEYAVGYYWRNGATVSADILGVVAGGNVSQDNLSIGRCEIYFI